MIKFKNKDFTFKFTNKYSIIVNGEKVTENLPKISARNVNAILELIKSEIDCPVKVDNLKDFFTKVNEKFLLYHLAVDLKSLNCSRYTMSKGPSTLDKLKEELYKKVSSVVYDAQNFIEDDFVSNQYLDILKDVAGVMHGSELSSWEFSEYYETHNEIQSIYDNFNSYDTTLVPVAKSIINKYNKELKEQVARYQSDLNYALELITKEGLDLVNWTQHKISRRLNKETKIYSTHFVDNLLNHKIKSLKDSGLKVKSKKVNKRKEDILSKSIEEMTQEELVYAFKNSNNESTVVESMNEETLVSLLKSKLKVVKNKLYGLNKYNRAQDTTLFITISNKLSGSKENYNLLLDIAQEYDINLEMEFLNKQAKFVNKRLMETKKDRWGSNGPIYINKFKVEQNTPIESEVLNKNLKKIFKSIKNISDIKLPFRNVVLKDMSREEIISQYELIAKEENCYRNSLHSLINETNYELAFNKVSLKDLEKFLDTSNDYDIIATNEDLINQFFELADKDMLLTYLKENIRNYYFDAKEFFNNTTHKKMIKNIGYERLDSLINKISDYKINNFLNAIELDKDSCIQFINNISNNKYVLKRLYKLDNKAFMQVVINKDISLETLPLTKMNNQDRLELVKLNYFAQSGLSEETLKNLFKGITRKEIAQTDFFYLENTKEVYYHNFDTIVRYAPHILSKKEVEELIKNEDYRFLIKNVSIVDENTLKKYLGDKEEKEIKESVLNAFNYGRTPTRRFRGTNMLDLRNTQVRGVYNQIISKVA
jgi:hypothetical protein